MKTYFLALAFVVTIAIVVCNAACVKQAMAQMGKINAALTQR